jgi:flavin-dependent dehydrogenase
MHAGGGSGPDRGRADLDVAVVGAGPAGAMAAWALARAGARVALLDGSHPREKPCGGGLTARALALLEPVTGAAAVPAVAVRRATFAASAGEGPGCPPPAEVPLPPAGGRPGLAVASRAALDGALLAAAVAAGATHVPRRVLDVAVDARGATLTSGDPGGPARWRAAVLLGSDGANSLVRRRLARPFPRAELSIGAGVFARGATGDAVAIAGVADPPGYLWSFPRPDHLAVGIGALADAGAGAPALRARTRAWLERSGLAPGAALEPYAWPIPSLSTAALEAERPAGPRWLLLGDAAGLVDPLTREGIHFALLSGRLAADAVLAAPGAPGPGYVARLRGEVYPELARAARLRAGFFDPAFLALLVEALGRSTRIRAVMADLVSGRQPYRGLALRLLATWELGTAAALGRLVLERRRPYFVPNSRSPASPSPGTM